jgi:hypothetical protein
MSKNAQSMRILYLSGFSTLYQEILVLKPHVRDLTANISVIWGIFFKP